MKRFVNFAVLIALTFGCKPAAESQTIGTSPRQEAAPIPASVSAARRSPIVVVAHNVLPSVVNIETEAVITRREVDPFSDPWGFFGARTRAYTAQSLGSGFIWSPDGIIVTNAHVVQGASKITVNFQDGTQMGARLIGVDPDSDVAVLRVDARNLLAAPIGTSSDLMIGETVIAVGNPFGLSGTVTTGVVSALGRSVPSKEEGRTFTDFIQTDASINPGNSGGALVNLRGELVGINSAILSRSGGNIGIGFAIPVDMVKSVMAQLIRYGEVKRGVLGVNIYDVTPEIAKEFGLHETSGALVAGVIQGSAADKAGIKTGDVIVALNGGKVTSAGELRNAIGMLRVGSTVRIDLLRDGQRHRLTATIGGQTDVETANAGIINKALDGAELADAPGAGGVLVKAIQDGSAAAQSGLRANDLIIGVGREAVTDTKSLRTLAKGATFLMLKVRRGTAVMLIPLR